MAAGASSLSHLIKSCFQASALIMKWRCAQTQDRARRWLFTQEAFCSLVFCCLCLGITNVALKGAVPPALLMSAGLEARAEWELPLKNPFRGIPAQPSIKSVLIPWAALGMTTETGASQELQWHLLKLRKALGIPCHA